MLASSGRNTKRTDQQLEAMQQNARVQQSERRQFKKEKNKGYVSAFH